MGWPDVIRLARGEITRTQGRPPRSDGADRSAAAPTSWSRSKTWKRSSVSVQEPKRGTRPTARPSRPPVVVVPGVVRLWLRDHVKAYKSEIASAELPRGRNPKETIKLEDVVGALREAGHEDDVEHLRGRVARERYGRNRHR